MNELKKKKKNRMRLLGITRLYFLKCPYAQLMLYEHKGTI
jgi:hypothetical protein